jgi:hypothetical protein
MSKNLEPKSLELKILEAKSMLPLNDSLAALGAWGTTGSSGTLGALGATGALESSGTLGSLGALGALGSLETLGAFGACETLETRSIKLLDREFLELNPGKNILDEPTTQDICSSRQSDLLKLIEERSLKTKAQGLSWAISIAFGDLAGRFLFFSRLKVTSENPESQNFNGSKLDGALSLSPSYSATVNLRDIARVMVGDRFKVISGSLKTSSNEPSRFTGASLCAFMTQAGLSGPEAIGPVIDDLVNRGCLKRYKGQLFPTKMGLALAQVLKGRLSLADPFHALSIETQLKEVATGLRSQEDIKELIRREASLAKNQAADLVKDIRACALKESKCHKDSYINNNILGLKGNSICQKTVANLAKQLTKMSSQIAQAQGRKASWRPVRG